MDHIRLITTDDWEAIYINGHKVIDGHSISASQLLEILDRQGDIVYESREVPSYDEYYESADECNDDTYDSVYFPDYLPESS